MNWWLIRVDVSPVGKQEHFSSEHPLGDVDFWRTYLVNRCHDVAGSDGGPFPFRGLFLVKKRLGRSQSLGKPRAAFDESVGLGLCLQ